MIFTPSRIAGAWLVDPEPLADERGFFARTVCVEAFAEHGLDARFVQQSVSRNTRAGILRGMHFQTGAHAEDKLVRVTTGAVHDVILDLRPNSATYLQWQAVELSAESQRALYIPRGVAHGFQTLTDLSEVFYQMTVPFAPGSSAGVRWNDPDIGIAWPACADRMISAKDLALPTLADLRER
ncbi:MULTISPECIES: dTDP-4-dehydrorhamnose 3,5-epimerase [unclassified Cupriavidus]|uniref:dTDP-4-dehydrorhamnose 3,5-epimerase n=1 Tax=unclassified Cupriavidus TaxID=2640874 RepID=UPI00088AF395|nr:dTDP-4-dehydrorhamnose 3,5-epimerase [Cupriavidus sp. YR651]SDC63826.1 dTDP-4-dehydrorhamnose 3,5-epimerase [Cupriavidus sp. YR651]